MDPLYRYYHSPKFGDLVYGLPVIRHLGKGVLYLDGGPEHGEQFVEQALPLLKRQPYIVDCKRYADEPYDYNLDTFRDVPDRMTRSLVDCHFLGIGFTPPTEIPPWLVAKRHRRRYPIIIHRSERYHGEVDYTFLHQVKRGDLFCVGYEEEVRNLREAIGAIWLQTANMDELAAVIQSCQIFIGNQSSPLALAVGLGKPRLLEECPWCPNCTYRQSNEIILGMDADANFSHLCRLGYSS